MDNFFTREVALLGEDGFARLKRASVIVFGAGGVGGAVIEALARSGIGAITVVDADKVEESNLNRQILATLSSIGKYKAEVAVERIKSINPDCTATAKVMFYLPENSSEIDLEKYDFVVDCIDTVTAKIFLAKECYKKGIRIISSAGTGNKLDATAFRITDIFSTSVCPLCKVMRRELKKEGVPSLKVLYSEEEPRVSVRPPASVSFVPPVAGYIIAGEVIKGIANV